MTGVEAHAVLALKIPRFAMKENVSPIALRTAQTRNAVTTDAVAPAASALQ
jgi:hypothetical protein